MTPSEAEAAIAVAPSTLVGPSYRYALAAALRSDGAPVQTVDRRLLAEVLDVPPTCTWGTALHPGANDGEGPFSPKFEMNGRRTFLPSDLVAEDESPLRSLAESSANPFVRGIVFDVLWVRFGLHTDARAAVDARAAAAALIDVETGWFEKTPEIIRAALLAIQLNDTARLRDVIGPAVEDVGLHAAGATDPGVFIGAANDLTHAILINKKFTRTAGAHAERWGITTLWAARELRRRGDLQRAEDGLIVAAALLAGAKLPAEALQVTTERVEWLLERAEAGDGLLRAHLIQSAIDVATETGLTKLANVAKSRLRQAVIGATAGMKAVRRTMQLPSQLAEAILETALRSPTAPLGVRSLAAAPWLTEISLSDIESAARVEAQSTVFLHLIPSVHYRDGKVAARASTPDEKVRESVGRRASIHVAYAELAIDYFLQVAFARFDQETLLHSIGRPSWMDARRISWLARASERFAAQDFASSGAIVLTQYEGLLRDRVRAAGHHALKYDSGTTQDETLNSLLRVPAVRTLLTEDHASFIEFFLCRPDIGPNLRNELAHGNLDARELRPGVVFLVWILMLRLVLLLTEEQAVAQEPPTPDGDLTTVPPTDGADTQYKNESGSTGSKV